MNPQVEMTILELKVAGIGAMFRKHPHSVHLERGKSYSAGLAG